MMDIVTKLPSIADDALLVLQGNAERLEKRGTAAQRKAAAELLPTIEAELTARREAKLAAARERAAAKRGSKRTASAAS